MNQVLTPEEPGGVRCHLEIGYLCAGMSFDVGKLELCIVGVHLHYYFIKESLSLRLISQSFGAGA